MAPGIIDQSDAPGLTGTSDKPVVYLLDSFHPDAIAHCQRYFHTILPGTKAHALWRQNARYLLIRSSYLTRDDVASCPNLVAIGKQGVGIDKIDAAACAERGIPIFNTPGVNARAVAELVLALTMAVAREIGPIASRQAAGDVVPKETCSGLVLEKRTIGILGMGNIGRCVARIFHGAFDANVVAYDPLLPAGAWDGVVPHKRVETVDELLREADVLTLHIPLTPQTANLISLPQLQLMKRSAILINTARGGIVNEADLELALEQGLIWGAGLDCHEQEPPTKERYGGLWRQRVVSTPHVGAATAQTQLETATAAVDRLYAFVTEKERGRGST